MAKSGLKTTTYSLDWDVVVNLESRLIRDFKNSPTKDLGVDLMIITIGTRLGLRVVDSLDLKWGIFWDFKLEKRLSEGKRKLERTGFW